MYCFFKDDEVKWSGRTPDKRLKAIAKLTFGKDAFRRSEKSELAKLGVYPYVVAPKAPPGTIITRTGVTSLSNGSVVVGYISAPDPDYVAPDLLALLVVANTKAIKEEAGRRIQAIIPEWKQRNLTARGVRLLHKGKGTWTDEEKAEWTAGEAAWVQVDATRSKSDLLEAFILTQSLEQLQEFNAYDDAVWV